MLYTSSCAEINPDDKSFDLTFLHGTDTHHPIINGEKGEEGWKMGDKEREGRWREGEEESGRSRRGLEEKRVREERRRR